MIRLHLFDDDRARSWRPFSLTRPVGELLFGPWLLRERWERCTGLECAGHLGVDSLAGFEERSAPPVVTLAEVPIDGPRLLVSSRAVPAGAIDPVALFAPEEPRRLIMAGTFVGWALPAGASLPGSGGALDVGNLGRTVDTTHTGSAEIPGMVLDWPWHLVSRTPEVIRTDAADWARLPGVQEVTPADLPAGVHLFGDGPLLSGEGVSLEPGVLLDGRGGPILLGAGVVVRGPARLAGPLFVGEGSTILGGSLGGSAIGPVCKVRGEVEDSVFTGYCNKAHDGFLGHACLGRWVNLGASTTNSDLKNNYSPVRVVLGDEEVETGEIKVGCFLGDHAKTGIGTLLNTGTVVGAGSNLFGGAMPPKYVPPFSWGRGSDLAEYRLDSFLSTARTVMGRRGIELGEGMAEMLAKAWEASAVERATRRG